MRRLAMDPSLDPADYVFTHEVRTRFAETDAMGVVHHAAYFVYLEEVRIAFLRSTGKAYESVRADGIELAVLEAFAAYRKPLYFDEVVRIHMAFGELTTATFQIAYLLTVDGEARATAVTVHGCIGPRGQPMRVPAWMKALAAPAAG